MTIDLLCNLLALVCLVVLSCLWIWGVHGAFIITGLAEHWFFATWPPNMKKPVFDCPVCMPTVHVPWVFFFAQANTAAGLPWTYLPLAWIMTAGLNFVIKEYLYAERDVRNHY